MNLHSDQNMSNTEDLLRVAVVEMRDAENGEQLFIAMGEDASDAIGYGTTSEEAIENLEEKLLVLDEGFLDWNLSSHQGTYLC